MIADWPPVVYALGAVTLISVAPLAVLPLLPHVDKTKSEAAQPLLLCFAAGGMLGDVFLHILPATLGGGHDHGHDHGDQKSPITEEQRVQVLQTSRAVSYTHLRAHETN